MCDAGDVVGARTALLPRDRIDDVRRRAAGDDDRPVTRKRPVVLGIAAAERKGRGHQQPKLLDNLARELDNLGLGIDQTSVACKDAARLLMPHKQAGVLQDLKRGSVHPLNLFRRQEGGKRHQLVTSSFWNGISSSGLYPIAAAICITYQRRNLSRLYSL